MVPATHHEAETGSHSDLHLTLPCHPAALLSVEVQVPFHAAAACSAAIKPGQEQLEPILRTAAVRVLKAILQSAQSAGLFKLQLSAPDASSTLAVSMLQQLQDAGLMQQLLVLLSNATDGLEHKVASRADGSENLHTYLDKAADVLTVSNYVIQLQQGVAAVLQAHAVLAPAACRAIAAGMRYLSVHLSALQQQQQRQQQGQQLQHTARKMLLLSGKVVVRAAEEYVIALGRSFIRIDSIPVALDAVPQLLGSHDLVPFLVLQLLVVSQGLLVQQPLQELRAAAAAEEASSRRGRQMQRTRGRSSSGGSSSNNSSTSVSTLASTEVEQPLTLLQQLKAQQRLPPTTPCQQQLYELLGVDNITLAWASQQQLLPHSILHFLGLLRLYRTVVEEQQQRQQHGAATQWLLHLLLPAVLLPCAARLCKPGSAAAAALGLSMVEQAKLCRTIAAVSCTSLHAWHGSAGSSSSSTLDDLQLWLGELRSLLLLVLHEVLLAMPHQQQQQQQPSLCAAAASTPAVQVTEGQGDWMHAAASLVEALLLLLGRQQHDLDAHVHRQDANAAMQQQEQQQVHGLPTGPGKSSAGGCSTPQQQQQQQHCSVQGDVPARGVRSAVPPALSVSGQLPFLCATFERLVRMQAAAIAAAGLDTYNDVIDFSDQALNLVGSGCCSGTTAGPPGVLTAAAQQAGLGQEGGRQYYSLLCSLVKLGYCVSRRSVLQFGTMWNPFEPAIAALSFIQHEVGEGASRTSMLDALPSLLIIGRCCLLWADILSAQGEDGRLALQQSEQLELRCFLHEFLTAVCYAAQGWLPARSAQLSAAGYPDPDSWLQQLLAAEAAAAAARQAEGDAVAAQCAVLVQELRALGQASCLFAVPLFCNNPRCMSLHGETEVSLVSGRACVCSGCRVARYCGRECLRQHWKQHKPVCKALAAAAATLKSGAGASAAGLPGVL